MSDETALQPPIKIRWFFWTFLALLLFVVIGVYSSRMANNATDYDAKRAMDRYETLNKLRETETQTLSTADWVDQDKKLVRIPIDEAMAKEIDVLKSKPLAMGGVIPGTMPPPVPAATTNAAPATAAAPTTPGSTNAAPVAPTKPMATTNAAPVAPAKPAPASTNAAPTAPAKPAPSAPVRTTHVY